MPRNINHCPADFTSYLTVFGCMFAIVVNIAVIL